jgi:hypothetical protein
MLNRADGHDREAALHKAMVERLRNGIFSDDPVDVKAEPEGSVPPQEVAILDEVSLARSAA